MKSAHKGAADAVPLSVRPRTAPAARRPLATGQPPILTDSERERFARRAAYQEGTAAGWDADEVRADIDAAEAPPVPRADRDGAPSPIRSTMGAVADTPGRMRPSRVGRDAAVDGLVVEWRPGFGRIAPTRGPCNPPALTPREISALRKRERAKDPPAIDPARAAREAAEEAVRSERIRRDRELRRRVYGK